MIIAPNGLSASFTALATAAAAPAVAGTIIDTGTPTPNVGNDWALGEGIAARFQVTGATTISGIEGYFSGGNNPGTYSIALYADGVDKPGNELFSTEATADVFGWNGKSGLGWAVNPGFYWVGFERRTGQTFFAGGMPSPSPSPLLDEAFRVGGVYYAADYLDVGIRIFDNAGNPGVPEPGTWAMMILGFAAVGLALRRRRAPVAA